MRDEIIEDKWFEIGFEMAKAEAEFLMRAWANDDPAPDSSVYGVVTSIQWE